MTARDEGGTHEGPEDLEDLVDRCSDLMWTLAHRVSGDDDVVAEQAVLGAWAQAARLLAVRDRDVPARLWLLRLVFEQLERESRGRLRTRRLLRPGPTTTTGAFAQALLAVPVRRRTAWVLLELLEMPAADAAEVLLCSELGARALATDARRNLVALLTSHERRASPLGERRLDGVPAPA